MPQKFRPRRLRRVITDQARALFEEVIRIQEVAYGPNHPHCLSNLEDCLERLRQTNDDRKAAEIEARIRAIRGK